MPGFADTMKAFFTPGQQGQQGQPGQQGQQPNNPGNVPTGAPITGATPPGKEPNGIVPNAGDTQQSPLDQFADLWQPSQNQNDPVAAFQQMLQIDPTKLMEAAKKQDFSKALTPEMINTIKAGGEGAMEAMLTALNNVAQATYAQSTALNTKLMSNAFSAFQQNLEGQIPGMIKKHQLGDNLRNENPVFSTPAVSPLIEAIKVQMVNKFPNATQEQLTKLSKEYISSVFAEVSKSNVQPTTSPESLEDWARFFDVPSQ